ncbi:hydrogenase maturation protease [Fodinibacter luteus]|uniref:hydrogenase maturation protease n=1 Tax=Fodinibacter luteus TaxID=552064 RepID=UPI0031E83734
MARPRAPAAALVVGLGSPDRGDDAVGGHVARAVAAATNRRVAVLEHEDPTDLIELWSGHDRVVVVDATCSGAAPGTVVVLEAGAEQGLLPTDAWARTGRGGTHAFGLAAAVELARVLGRLPARLTVVGVEAVSFEPGAPLSRAVADTVPDAVDAVLGALQATAGAVAHGGRGADVPR